MPPEINHEKCIACGKCVDICPVDVFFGTDDFGKTKGKQPDVTYPEACWHCNWCVKICPVEDAVSLRIPLSMFVAYK